MFASLSNQNTPLVWPDETHFPGDVAPQRAPHSVGRKSQRNRAHVLVKTRLAFPVPPTSFSLAY